VGTSLAWEPYHVQKPGEPRPASASKDSTLRVWSTNQQTIELVLSGHRGSVSCVKWGGTGFIYTGSHDKTVCKKFGGFFLYLWSPEILNTPELQNPS
jgi:ribosome assembly protein 4